MKLVNWKPNHSMFDILDNFDGYFNHFIDSNYTYENNRTSINQNEKSYFINLEIPGFDKSDLDISIDEDVLKITGKRGDVNKSFIKNDNINKSFYLPEDIIINKIKAKALNGILCIEIPKLKKGKKDIKKFKYHNFIIWFLLILKGAYLCPFFIKRFINLKVFFRN